MLLSGYREQGNLNRAVGYFRDTDSFGNDNTADEPDSEGDATTSTP